MTGRRAPRAPRLAVLALTLALAACGGEAATEQAEPEPATETSTEAATDTAPPAAAPAGPIRIELEEQNASGQAGTATLRPRGNGAFEVAIEMSPPAKFPGGAQNAHIHNVTCAEYAAMTDFNERLATVVDWLSNLSKGSSTTKVEVPLAERATGAYAINVHEQDAPYTVVACGDIPRPSR
jgi:hypothetical protein